MVDMVRTAMVAAVRPDVLQGIVAGFITGATIDVNGGQYLA